MKSPRLTALIPMLPVRNVAASVEFYRKLGFAVERRNDSWGWARLQLGECRLMVDQSLNVQPDAPRQTIVYLYPDDVVQYHAEIRRNGVPVPELQLTFYGMQEFRIEDPDGNRLWIGQVTPGSANS